MDDPCSRSAAYKVKIPLFVELAIEARPLFARAFTIFYLIMILVEIGVLFSINIYVLREKSFWRSCKGAWIPGIITTSQACWL